MPNTSYAVVLTFSGEANEAFTRLRDDYKQYMDYTIVPHITLYHFKPEVDMDVIKEKLKEVAKGEKSFTLVLDGVDYFEVENNVAYVAIQNTEPVEKLHRRIVYSLRGVVTELSKYTLDDFIPHMTIGENIPVEIFSNVKQRFFNYKTHYECKMADFSLFAENKKVWSQEYVFKFQS